MTPRDDQTRFDDDDLVREGGVFVARNGGREVECEDGECAPDDYAEDPMSSDGVPGTVDDLPYTYGVELPDPADETLQSFDRAPSRSWGVGLTGPAEDGDEQQLGGPEERELWKQQRALIEEADAEERHYAGLSDAKAEEAGDASVEDVAEPLPDSPEGKSATGAVSAEE